MISVKKFLIAWSLLLSVVVVRAQAPPDFTITDIHGTEWNLYDQLGKGKTIVLDFFFKDCKPCQTYTPMIEQLYQDYGADTGKVLVIGISDRDDNESIKKFEKDFGVTYPSCGYEGGGDTVTTLYQNWFTFLGWPMYAVVCPDTTIHWNVPKSDSLPEIRSIVDQCPKGTNSIRFGNENRPGGKVYIKNDGSIRIAELRSYKALEIIALDGRVLKYVRLVPGEKSLDIGIDNLSPGMYSARLIGSNYNYVQKFIVY